MIPAHSVPDLSRPLPADSNRSVPKCSTELCFVGDGDDGAALLPAREDSADGVFKPETVMLGAARVSVQKE